MASPSMKRLSRERDRYRAALRAIVEGGTKPFEGIAVTPAERVRYMRETARIALEGDYTPAMTSLGPGPETEGD